MGGHEWVQGEQELSHGRGLAHRPGALTREQKASLAADGKLSPLEDLGHGARPTPLYFLERSCLFQHPWSFPFYPELHSLPCPWMMLPLALCPGPLSLVPCITPLLYPPPTQGPGICPEMWVSPAWRLGQTWDTISGVIKARNGADEGKTTGQ